MAFDSATGRLWVPSGGSGRVDVIDVKTGALTSIADQPTKAHGERRSGVSSASVGDGVVFVGNRANETLCRFDSKSLAAKGCVTLAASPDGVLWVPATREVWVTLPEVNSLAIISTAGPALTVAATIKLQGSPEGYGFDAKRGLFQQKKTSFDTAILAYELSLEDVVSIDCVHNPDDFRAALEGVRSAR